MNDWTKNTSRGRWKSGNRKPSDSQIPTTPAAATFLRPPQNQTHAKVLPISPVYCVTYVPVHSRRVAVDVDVDWFDLESQENKCSKTPSPSTRFFHHTQPVTAITDIPPAMRDNVIEPVAVPTCAIPWDGPRTCSSPIRG